MNKVCASPRRGDSDNDWEFEMNILVLCTGNSARSILAEAILNRYGGEKLTAFSAGSKPVGAVNPVALKLLEKEGYDVSGFRSKSWDEFSGNDAPDLDIVITVCGNAAGETCPIWVGAPITVHWGFPDPASVDGANDEKLAAFNLAYQALEKNVGAFLALDLKDRNPEDLRREMIDIHAGNEPMTF